MNPTKQPKPTATSRTSPVSKAGHDGRRGIYGDPGTFTTAARSGVSFPNEDVTNTITLEEYHREGR